MTLNIALIYRPPQNMINWMQPFNISLQIMNDFALHALSQQFLTTEKLLERKIVC